MTTDEYERLNTLFKKHNLDWGNSKNKDLYNFYYDLINLISDLVTNAQKERQQTDELRCRRIVELISSNKPLDIFDELKF